MSNSEIEIVVDDPTAPEADSPAVTATRVVDVTVSLLLLAPALTLGFDHWRTGIAWDSPGAQGGFGNLRHTCATPARHGGVRSDAAVLSCYAVSWTLCRELSADLRLHANGRPD